MDKIARSKLTSMYSGQWFHFLQRTTNGNVICNC